MVARGRQATHVYGWPAIDSPRVCATLVACRHEFVNQTINVTAVRLQPVVAIHHFQKRDVRPFESVANDPASNALTICVRDWPACVSLNLSPPESRFLCRNVTKTAETQAAGVRHDFVACSVDVEDASAAPRFFLHSIIVLNNTLLLDLYFLLIHILIFQIC